MSRLLLTIFLLFWKQILFAQSILKCNERLTDIDLVCEYFSNLDSAFAANHQVSEITVTESYINHGVIRYEKTKLNYKYDKLFKRVYAEVNIWSEDGRLIRGDITNNYDDSVINVQMGWFRHTNGTSYIHKYVQKAIWLNDTLLKKNTYTYLNDSLFQSEDLGIEDTRAELREYERMKKLADSFKTVTITAPPDIIVREAPDYSMARPHDDIITKDSLGRVVATEQFFLTTINDQQGSFPGNKFFIGYLDSTRIIRSITAFNDFNSNRAYFEERIKAGTDNSWNHFWPENKVHANLYFAFTASDFRFGIPRQVVISMGKDAVTQRIYRVIISTR